MWVWVAAGAWGARARGGGWVGRVEGATEVGLGMNVVRTGGVAALVAVLAPSIGGLFITDPRVVTLGATLLHIAVLGPIPLGLSSVFSGVMRASGTVLVPTTITLSLLALVLFPLGWTFNRVVGLPGIWLAHPTTYLTGLTLHACYFSAVWQMKPLRRLV